MKKTILTAFAAVTLSFGTAGTVMATGDGSQSLGGRTFLVEVEVVSSLISELPVGTVFPNCYIFEPGGVWVDPAFPVPGTWLQHKDNANTPYTAFADADGLFLVQRGWVRPVRGGVVEITAQSTAFIGELKLAEFVSIGEQVDECPL